MSRKPSDNRLSLIEDFLCAGVSSLLLIVVRLHSDLSLLSLVALIPYFRRLLRVTVGRTIVMGAVLAFSYLFVANADSLITSPGTFALQLACLNLIFISFGVAVSKARTFFGINPLLLLLLWLPLDFGLNQLPGLDQALWSFPLDGGVTSRFSVLSHFLVVTAIIVLLNPLLLIVATYVVEHALSRQRAFSSKEKRKYSLFESFKITREWYYFPDFRSPPAVPS